MNCIEFEKKLVDAGLTKESFSGLTNIPIATVKNWMAKRKGKYSDCPKWVEPYLNLHIDSKENKIYIKKLIEELRGNK